LRGWQWSGIFTAVTGPPMDILDGPTMSGLTNDRPDVNPSFTGNPILGKVNEWINPAAFTLEPVGTLGNLGRDTAIGPGLWSLDTAVMKDTKITEALRVQFRAEFFNIFNHTNFNVPPNLGVFILNSAGTPSVNPTFGQLTSTATTSRQIQFGVKFLF
jgi:hypothetical protein